MDTKPPQTIRAFIDLLGRTSGDPIGCLAPVDALPDGVRGKGRGRDAQRILELQVA